MSIFFSEVQKEKVQSPMEITESGMTISVRDSHPAKAMFPMDVTESGMAILVSEVQPVSVVQSEKAQFPMDVTESGMVIFFSDVQHEKAFSPIEVTGYVILSIVIEDGIFTDVAFVVHFITLAVFVCVSSANSKSFFFIVFILILCFSRG